MSEYTEYNVFCPFEKEGFCGLDTSTGKVLEDDKFKKNINTMCGLSGKKMWECTLRRKFMLTISRPGSCIADIPDTDMKIKARMQRIEHLELEKICIQDKIDIMKHEIEELNAMLDKPRK
jgi:hypothetical protein